MLVNHDENLHIMNERCGRVTDFFGGHHILKRFVLLDGITKINVEINRQM